MVRAFTVEYARSGRSRCHTTHELIELGALRIGVCILGQWGHGQLWHKAESFAYARSGLVSVALLSNLEALRPEDQRRVEELIAASLQTERASRAADRRKSWARSNAGPPAEAAFPPLLLLVAAVLLLLECVLPASAAVLERAGKEARLRERRRLYTAINLARTARLRLRWRCCRRRPAFGASEVAPGFFLGSMADAHNLEELQARGIVAVVTVSPGIPPPFQAANLRYLCLDVIDLPNEPLREHCCAAAAFCDEMLGPSPTACVDVFWRGLRFAYPQLNDWTSEEAEERHAAEPVPLWVPSPDAPPQQAKDADEDEVGKQGRRGGRERSPSAGPPPRAGEAVVPAGRPPAVLFHCVHGTSRSATILAAVKPPLSLSPCCSPFEYRSTCLPC